MPEKTSTTTAAPATITITREDAEAAMVELFVAQLAADDDVDWHAEQLSNAIAPIWYLFFGSSAWEGPNLDPTPLHVEIDERARAEWAAVLERDAEAAARLGWTNAGTGGGDG